MHYEMHDLMIGVMHYVMHYVVQAELAAALRLGEESFLFIDDNPTECAAVRAALPHVPAWCFPQAHITKRIT